MYRNVMVAIDNSEHSRWAIGVAMSLARATGARLTGCHVCAAQLHDRRFRQMEPGLPDQYQRQEMLMRLRDVHDGLIGRGLGVIADSYLDVFEEECKKAGVAMARKTLEGRNYACLVQDTRESGYDLVIIGAHGLGRVDRATLGSVCERVSRLVECDLLVVRDEPPLGGGPLLVAVDGSDSSMGALEVALGIGKRYGVPLLAAAAYDPYFHTTAFQSIAGVLSDEAAQLFRFKEQETLHDEIIDRGLGNVYQAHLDRARRRAEEEGMSLETLLLEGKPYDAIAGLVEETRPSLLVVGRTGIHHEEGVSLGSTAENLLRLARCNVLVANRIPGEGTADAREAGEAAAGSAVTWSPEAEERLARAPFFVRKMARRRIESFAKERGHREITIQLYEEARRQFGM